MTTITIKLYDIIQLNSHILNSRLLVKIEKTPSQWFLLLLFFKFHIYIYNLIENQEIEMNII